MNDNIFTITIIGLIISSCLLLGTVFMLQNAKNDDPGTINPVNFYEEDTIKTFEHIEFNIFPQNISLKQDDKCSSKEYGTLQISLTVNEEKIDQECTTYLDGFFKGRFFTKEESQNAALGTQIPLKINISSVLLEEDHIIELCCDDYCKVKVFKNYCEV